MSLQQCGATATTGFPLSLNRNIFDAGWGVDESTRKKMVSPTDFNINWGVSNPAMRISTLVDGEQFQINLPGDYASATTITYDSGRGSDLLTYTSLPVLSITGIRHSTLVKNDDNPTQEAIFPFIIDSSKKQNNPTSPDIILLCRPLILSTGKSSSSFWTAVNSSAKAAAGRNERTGEVNLASVYTYGDADKTLLPMMTYETCIPTRFIGGPTQRLGSVLVRVHVVSNPLVIYSEETGTGLCRRVSKYIFPSIIKRLISSDLRSSDLQFSTGVGPGTSGYQFPTNTNTGQYQPTTGPSPFTTWDQVTSKLEYLIPEALLGKSLASIANASTAPSTPRSSGGRNFKCYTIDPQKDIVNGQINIDPTTGESLNQLLDYQSGGDPALAAGLAGQAVGGAGILPGDVEYVLFIVITTICTISIVAYTFHVLTLFYEGVKPERYAHVFLLLGMIGVFIGLQVAFAPKKKIPIK